jgi:hypothetical protein
MQLCRIFVRGMMDQAAFPSLSNALLTESILCDLWSDADNFGGVNHSTYASGKRGR